MAHPSYAITSNPVTTRLQVRALSAAAPDPAHMPHLDAADGGPVRLHDLYVRLGEALGFEASLAQIPEIAGCLCARSVV